VRLGARPSVEELVDVAEAAARAAGAVLARFAATRQGGGDVGAYRCAGASRHRLREPDRLLVGLTGHRRSLSYLDSCGFAKFDI